MMCNRMIANIFRRHLKEFDITDSQLSILFFVSKKENPNQKQIADFLATEKSTVNRNIKRLITRQYISFSEQKLALTSNGKELLERLIPSWENAMNEVNAILGDEGEQALNNIYTKLNERQC